MKPSRPTGKAKLRPARLTARRALENDDKVALERSMTDRQRRFCHEYVVDFNANAAVLRAGYLTKYPARQAVHNLSNPGIVALIDDLKTEKSYAITSVDPNYVISKITAIVSDPDAKHADQLRGLELLAKHLGMFIERQELTGKDGGPLSVVQEEIKQEAEDLVGLLQQLHDRNQKEAKDDAVAEGNVVEFKKSA